MTEISPDDGFRDDRTWFWIVVDPTGRKAVIAPPDRSELALLERRRLSGLALAEARSQIVGEANEWQHRDAWAAHGAGPTRI